MPTRDSNWAPPARPRGALAPRKQAKNGVREESHRARPTAIKEHSPEIELPPDPGWNRTRVVDFRREMAVRTLLPREGAAGVEMESVLQTGWK